MIKNGFTLAEVLITLTVIGVVASVTLPNLNVNIQKQSVGPSLAKAINTMENAIQLTLTDNNARSLENVGAGHAIDRVSGIQWTERNIAKNKSLNLSAATGIPNIGTLSAAAYLQVAASPVLPGGNIQRPNAGIQDEEMENPGALQENQQQQQLAGEAGAVGGLTCNSTKDGIQFCKTSNAVTAVNNFNFANMPGYSGRYYVLYIDINGDKAPNEIGTDVFHFLVDTRGSVIPFGGRAYQQYIGGNNVLWANGGCSTPKARPTNVDSCAGSIVDNGFKVIY